MLAKLTSKNQLTLPKAVISGFGGVTYFDVTSERGRIVLIPVRINRADALAPLASRDPTTELIRVLGHPKFGLTVGEREDLLGDYLTYAETVVISQPPAVPACRDFEIPIVTPGEARRLLARRPTP